MNKLNALSLGYAGAVVSALAMLVLGVLGNIGIYTGAVVQMQKWHMYFSLSTGGIIAGMVEAAVISFICLYIFGFVYNLLAQ